MNTVAFDHDLYPDVHPIFVACYEGNLASVRQFLNEGIDVNIKYEFHPSLASTAISMGYPDVLGVLIERGLDVNAALGNFGQRPLHHIASRSNSVEMAHLLLAHGADPNIQDKYGATPIQCAASSGNLEYLELLLAAGADPAYVSPDGQDAFYAAVISSRFECAERLLGLGGDVNTQDHRGKTALCRIAMGGRGVEMAKWLLAHGADKSIPDNSGDTPLDWARENGRTAIVKLLE